MVAEVMSVTARRVRVSAGLMVQVVSMALLGPAPAVAMGILAMVPDALVNRVWRLGALNNMAIFGFIGLIGGVMFELLGGSFGLDRDDTAYALLIPPVSVRLRVESRTRRSDASGPRRPLPPARPARVRASDAPIRADERPDAYGHRPRLGCTTDLQRSRRCCSF
jgi:hypothetical protein